MASVRKKLYSVWSCMINRCHKPDDKDFKYYGAKGIQVCQEWRDSFDAFHAWAMANGYEEGLSIDRREGTLNYDPDNCRWRNPKQQTRNRSNTVTLTAFGETKPLAEWVEDERCSVTYQTLSHRINNLKWPVEEAITTPKRGEEAEPEKREPIAIRDRIKDLRRVRAGDLVPNPKNWRQHPPEQRAALEAVVGELGFAGAILARELDDGRLMICDGHARQELDENAVLPVLVTDLTEEEADKLLLTYDPIGALATADAQKLDALMASVRTDAPALQAMLRNLAVAAKCPSTLPQPGLTDPDAVPEPPVRG